MANNEYSLYTIRIKTADRQDAGTDAKVSLRLADSKNGSIVIPDLEKWGVMGRGHDYFERGNLDTFSYVGKSLATPICYMKVSHDNTGNKPGWYVSYVEVSVVGTEYNKRWVVEQWLALDEPPYSLSSTRDDCSYEKSKGDQNKN